MNIDDLAASLAADSAAHTLERVRACFFLANREERKARVNALMVLSAELEGIKLESCFCIAIGIGVLQSVIDGHWERVADSAEDFRFEGEEPDLVERYRPLWARFAGLCRTVAAEGKARALARATQGKDQAS